MTHPIPLKNCSTAWTLSAFADEAGESSDQQIAAIRRADLKHIDLRGIDGFNISVLPLDHAERIRAKLDAASIRVAMFGSPIGKIDIADDFQIDLDKLAHLGNLSEILGCKAVRIFSYYNKNSRPMNEWKTEAVGRLKKLRDRAAELGLVLYHENEGHIFGDPSDRVAVIGRELRDPGSVSGGGGGGGGVFRMIYDFDNYNRTAADPWQVWLEQRDMVDAFHLKDSDVAGQHVPVGEGKGMASRILADALARGWHGPLSLEPHLQHSQAVMATVAVIGMEAGANRKFAEMTPADCFHTAAEAAKRLLGEIKAPVA